MVPALLGLQNGYRWITPRVKTCNACREATVLSLVSTIFIPGKLTLVPPIVRKFLKRIDSRPSHYYFQGVPRRRKVRKACYNFLLRPEIRALTVLGPDVKRYKPGNLLPGDVFETFSRIRPPDALCVKNRLKLGLRLLQPYLLPEEVLASLARTRSLARGNKERQAKPAHSCDCC